MGVVYAAQAVLPSMKARRHGRIVAIASTAGLKGYAYVSAYAAAKHAVVGLVRSLALEVATSGITVNAVCPGFTDTDLVAASVDTIMIVKAYVVLRPGLTGDAALVSALQDHVKREIAPYKYPRAIVFLDQLPKTQTGKLKRFTLRQMAQAGDAASTTTAAG